MKKTAINLCAILCFSLTFTACNKAELPNPAPETQTESQLKKPAGGQTTTTTYGGRSTGIDATVWDFQSAIVTSTQKTFADTYFLPTAGGTITASEQQAEMQGTFTSGALTASTTGQNNSTVSEASVSTLNITTGGHTISAGYAQATATAGCGGALSGTSQVTNLVVNGQTIAVTGAANQTIYLANGGMIIINARSTSKKGSSILNVIALHILIPNVADIRIASARADIKC